MSLKVEVLKMFQEVWPTKNALAFGSAVYRPLLRLPTTNTDIDIVTDVEVTRVGMTKVMEAYFDVVDFKCNEHKEAYNIPQIKKRYQFTLADGSTIDLVFTDSTSCSNWHVEHQASPLTQAVEYLSLSAGLVRRNTDAFSNIRTGRVLGVLARKAKATKEHVLKLHNLAKELDITLQVQ